MDVMTIYLLSLTALTLAVVVWACVAEHLSRRPGKRRTTYIERETDT